MPDKLPCEQTNTRMTTTAIISTCSTDDHINIGIHTATTNVQQIQNNMQFPFGHFLNVDIDMFAALLI